jgi:hypothetical protein
MLSFLTEPKFPKAAIGIERDAITALSLQRSGKTFGIRQAATVEVPTRLLIPNFLDRNITEPTQFRYLLEEAVTTAGLRNRKRWSVSLPSSTARSAIITMDLAGNKGESEEIFDWKAEQSFGAPASELRITREKLSPDAEGRIRYFATAVKLSVLDEYETIFEQFNWKCGLILPRALSESSWLKGASDTDSLLISTQSDGFTAMMVRGNEPFVVRSVTCRESERDDEIYRLLMFYNDRFASETPVRVLARLLLVGRGLVPEKIREIADEALGRGLQVLKAGEIGLDIPVGNLRFDDVAAPAGLAALGWQ